jgi:copper transport protein
VAREGDGAASDHLVASGGAASDEARETSSVRVAQLGATGLAPVFPSRARVAVVGVVAVVWALLPVLAGHATTRAHPVLLTASGTVHVLAAAMWVGGLAVVLFAVPAALRALRVPDRKALLAAVLRRFSGVALLAVGALAVTGVVQAVVEVGSVAALRDVAFGRAVTIKAGLLLMVAGVASAHHATRDERATNRTLRTEALLVVALLATTGVLAGSAPPGGAPAGPPQLRLAYEQATARGTYDDNTLILALARPNGLAFTDLERLDVVARGPGGRQARASVAARTDGAYAIPLALRPSGRWRLALTLRVDTYNSYTRTTEVSVP